MFEFRGKNLFLFSVCVWGRETRYASSFSGSYLEARSVPCSAVYDPINPFVVVSQLPFHSQD